MFKTQTGLFNKLRVLYFKKRTPERMAELEALARDVEYYIVELRRLEKRTGLSGMVSVPLRTLDAQLTYLFERMETGTDAGVFKKLANKHFCRRYAMQVACFDPTLPGTFFIEEEEGGNEFDIHFPLDCLERIPIEPMVQGIKLRNKTKEELLQIISNFNKIYEELATMSTKRKEHKRREK